MRRFDLIQLYTESDVLSNKTNANLKIIREALGYTGWVEGLTRWMVMDAREPRVSRPTARRDNHVVAFGASLISRVHSLLHPMQVKSVEGMQVSN